MSVAASIESGVVHNPERLVVTVVRGNADTGLTARIAAGDEAAMRELHAEYGRSVFGLLRRMLPDHASAEDVFQQVMLEVWQRADSFDAARGTLTTWLLTLARSRAIDELRRRRPDPVDPAELAGSVGADTGMDGLVGEWEVSQALLDLPEDERRLIEMRFRLDLSQSEIAEHTGIPLGTVKTRMNRGLHRLRERLVPHVDGPS